MDEMGDVRAERDVCFVLGEVCWVTTTEQGGGKDLSFCCWEGGRVEDKRRLGGLIGAGGSA